ncbi:M48 family metallopeptidase [Falsirhodobacter sp. 20TX0035]|uniref:M48 family metallopeptidase n=1 Tax=Falsirhodobacter sp. 20TX0035 TaxID=3022019 RepID=UPI002330F70B|nr:SprT family zinc-dependent metalloprotease [Falsirhodobacter sp. 20TX0035]MDB6452221.1 SprT family zinc-dependent metalloprotease [Falsirhodobacter sp. 20TX0035]
MPVLPGLPEVDLVLRRSARTRRFSLRVSRLDGKVTLSMPARAREAEAMAFAGGHADWLRDVLADLSPAALVAHGTVLPVDGRALVLTPGRGRVRVEGDSLIVPDPVPARAAAWLRTLARDRLAAACDRHSATLGRPYTRLTLRDTRSRWGSCTSDGALMFSWRLILAPPPVLDYVAAHEVAHLDEMNHSPAFWAVVARLCPDYAALRGWLRGPEGQALQAWRFA